MTYLGRIAGSFLTIAMVMAEAALAIPPSPEARQKWIDQDLWNQKVESWRQFKAAGGCAPSQPSFLNSAKLRRNLAQGVQVIDTINVILILVDFSDNPWPGGGAAVTSTMFDSLLFSNRDIDPVFMPTGSMTDFYLENSYGQFYIKGDVFGWYRAPQTYAYYEGGNDGLNAQVRQLVRDVVLQADAAGANFSNYDYDNDGFCDGVLVAHAGAGAETGAFGIWSHAWSISPSLTLDGVVISDYNINPEEAGGGGPSSIGVFCHEYGHFLGLPDLYDVDYDPPGSDGTGDWSLMSGGSWNGGGVSPSHFDAWSKSFLGFVNVINVTSNLNQVQLPAVEYNPVVYRLSNIISQPDEYWYVENRQMLGFDATLPGSGILIFHVDYSMEGSNYDNTHWFVGVEQADGLFDLEWNASAGDAGDPFPGSSNAREFHDLTVPSSSTNVSATPTHIGLWNISDNDSIMYADLHIAWSQPYVTLSGGDSLNFNDPLPLGDNDGDLDPGETIDFYCTVKNHMQTGYNPRVNLSTDNPDVTFLVNDVPLNGNLTASPVSNSLNPVKLLIDGSVEAVIDTFILSITSDSLATTPGSGEFVNTFAFTYSVGTPRILFVDDDRGAATEAAVSAVFENFRKPYRVWRKNSEGIPTGAQLNNYPMVFWSTGDSAGGVLNATDIASMKNYLDSGGNLFLSTMSGIQAMHNVDSAFMRDYFKARYTSTSSQLNIRGVDGTLLGSNSRYKAPLLSPFENDRQTMSVVSGGEAFLSYTLSSDTPTAAISYDGAFNTVLLGFPFEAIRDDVGGTWWPKDTLIERIMFWLFDSPDSTNPRSVLSLLVANEAQYNVVSPVPTFGWTSKKGYPADFQSKYQIQIGSDNNWATAELWNPGEISSVDTTVVYDGAPLLDGSTFYIRIRVENGFVWSDWYETTFRMNTPPAAPIPLRPVSDALTLATPKLYVTNSADAEGDSPVSYIFEIYSDMGLTTLVAADSLVTQTADSTGWTSDVALAYATRYWWKSQANDGYEKSPYSTAATFIVQSAPQAPGAPTALTPADTGAWPVFTVLPAFDWTDAVDPNQLDVLTYRLKIGLDSLFLSTININGLPASQHTLTSPLLYNKKYWWRVTTQDNTGLTSVSSNTRTFWTWTLGDVNHSHTFDIIDLNAIVNRLFRGGPAPNPSFVGDLNGDCKSNILDLNYAVNRFFRGGSLPVVGCSK